MTSKIADQQHWSEAERQNFQMLANCLSAERWPAALLLHCHQADFMSEYAQQIMKMLLCRTHSNCGSCPDCQQISHGFHNETLVLDASLSERIGIDEISSIQEHLSYQSMDQGAGGQSEKYRLVVIHGIERCSIQAANKLLKTLEDLNPNSAVIATTAALGRLLPTIRSRFLLWRLPNRAVQRHLPDFITKLLPHSHNWSGLMNTLEAYARSKEVNASTILNQCELTLNDSYRSVLGLKEQPADTRLRSLFRDWSQFDLVYDRRVSVRLAKEKAIKSKIALNTQLVAEKCFTTKAQ